jgi:uncharacterized protein YkwD
VARRTALFVFITLMFIGLARPANAATDAEKTMKRYMNHERLDRNIQRMRMSDRLVQIARAHSREMSASLSLYHNAELAQDLSSVNFSIAGENVGVGPSLESLHQAFMDSRPHRENILRGKFDHLGVGVIGSSDGRIWITVVFSG